uniref:YceI family protein n=1 Tax=Delftia acidovorans TaxID=80866 RepID=UPI0035A1B2E3
MRFSSTLTSIALAAAALASQAALAEQKLVPAQSAVNFTAKQMGVPLQGHFKKFDAQVQFDTAKPDTSKIRFTVDTGSATMGAKETDAELPKADWFNVAKYPQAVF